MDLMSGIIMPTPSAMLTAMELLSDGWDEIPGIGELVGVDLAGPPRTYILWQKEARPTL